MALTSPRASFRSRPNAPEDWDDDVEHRRVLAETANSALRGHLNNGGTVTLTASATSTTVSNAHTNAGSTVFLQPVSENAGNTRYYITTADGSFTIVHDSQGFTDRTFNYAVFNDGTTSAVVYPKLHTSDHGSEYA